MAEFFAMGGYAFYVWTAYGLALAVLAGMAVQSLLWHRRVVRWIRRQPALPTPDHRALAPKRSEVNGDRGRSS